MITFVTNVFILIWLNLLLEPFHCAVKNDPEDSLGDNFIDSYRSGNQSGTLFPLILVPGDGGSQIEAKLNKSSVVHYFCNSHTDDYFTLWVHLSDVLPYAVDCFMDNMRLVYDNVTRTTSNSPGVETRIPGFGGTDSVEYLDPSRIAITGYYNILVDAMVKIGYERGKSIRAAPYDFRKSPRELGEYLDRFKTLIEETFDTNDGLPCIIVCHSMGCPLMLYFLVNQSKEWKQRHVKSLVTLAGPWGGAVKALKAFSSGDNLGVIVIPELTVRQDERTFSSMAFLLPKRDFWPPNEVIIRHGLTNYTTANYDQFFRDINYQVGHEMWLDIKDLLAGLPAPGVEVHCIHGNGISTMEYLEYQQDDFPDHRPEITFGDGDGTVNIRSLEGCLRWRNQQSQIVNHLNFTGVDHLSVMADPGVISYIESIVGPEGIPDFR